jgi:hypothetical protein
MALQTVLLLLQVQETVDRFELNAEQGDVLTRCARYNTMSRITHHFAYFSIVLLDHSLGCAVQHI